MLASHNWQIQSIPTPWTYVRDDQLRFRAGFGLRVPRLQFVTDSDIIGNEDGGYGMRTPRLQYTAP
jgi:hypothetical protein